MDQLFAFTVQALLWTQGGGVATVTCAYMSSCIVPARFPGGDEVVIHWLKKAEQGNINVHSYYRRQDQLKNQDGQFKGRTSLFKDQISKGNASLLLEKVAPSDQGRYQCYYSNDLTHEENFIFLNVEASVHRVYIQQRESYITCSSKGIFPKPVLTWSSSPHSAQLLQGNTSVQPTKQRLYNIISSLKLPDNASHLVFSCSVRAGNSSWKATLSNANKMTVSRGEIEMQCPSRSPPPTVYTWTFNHSEVILSQVSMDSAQLNITERWKPLVRDVSKPETLALKGLHPQQSGIYTCQQHNSEQTYITAFSVTVDHDKSLMGTPCSKWVLLIVAVLFIVALGVCCYCYCNKRQKILEDPI